MERPKYLTEATLRVLQTLVESDRVNCGQPALEDAQITAAGDALVQILSDPDALTEYLAEALSLYRESGHRFTHCTLLSECDAARLMSGGPGQLLPKTLAELLLSPFALTEMAEQLRDESTDWWQPHLDRANTALETRYARLLGEGGA